MGGKVTAGVEQVKGQVGTGRQNSAGSGTFAHVPDPHTDGAAEGGEEPTWVPGDSGASLPR